MLFKDGEETGDQCPDCGKPLYFYMGFEDCFSYKSGHYTIDAPMIVCENCDYQTDYVLEDDKYEKDF